MIQNSQDCLGKLPSVMFDETTHSLLDSLRREPAEHCTSTLEAVARALLLLGAYGNNQQQQQQQSASAAKFLEQSLAAMVDGQLRYALDGATARPRYYRKNETADKHTTNTNKTPAASKRAEGRSRKTVSRRRRAELSLPRPKTAEELELERIRFVYVAHMG
jgi:hypothetical protein